MRLPDPEYPQKIASSPAGDETDFDDEESFVKAFVPMAREVEENVELYFSDLASVSDSISGECFDDETHANFYVASREVISQGLKSQLEFLRDNAPRAFALLLRKAGFASSCDK
jgi:hypothetical protein